MNYLINTQIIRTTVLLFIFGLLAGCANYYSNDGKTAVKEETLPLTVTQDTTRDWQTQDIRVKYSVDEKAGGLSLSGTLYLNDRLYYSFPAAQYFHLYINYLNENDRVIGSYDISPLIPYLIPFQDSFKLPTVPRHLQGQFPLFSAIEGPSVHDPVTKRVLEIAMTGRCIITHSPPNLPRR